MKQKIFVIGSQGQLASELKSIQNQSDRYTLTFLAKESIDILNQEAIRSHLKSESPDFVINCSAYTAVDKAETDQESAYAINETGVRNLAEICRELNVFLVHISTDFVFDGTKSMPYTEEDMVNPLSVYGRSKLNGELAIKEAGCQYIIIRTSWLYSAFGANFVKTMLRLGLEKDSLNVVSDQIGSPTYARDLAQFILDHLDQFPGHANQIYHYSNEGIASWFDFATEIMKQHHLSCQVNPIPTSGYPTPAARPAYSVMDKSKIKRDFNLTIPHWKESLQLCIERL